MRSYQQSIKNHQNKWGNKFDDSGLSKQFIKYYENQARIEVDFGYEVERGRVGMTTGWKPSFILMLTTRSTGSSYLLSDENKIINIISL